MTFAAHDGPIAEFSAAVDKMPVVEGLLTELATDRRFTEPGHGYYSFPQSGAEPVRRSFQNFKLMRPVSVAIHHLCSFPTTGTHDVYAVPLVGSLIVFFPIRRASPSHLFWIAAPGVGVDSNLDLPIPSGYAGLDERKSTAMLELMASCDTHLLTSFSACL